MPPKSVILGVLLCAAADWAAPSLAAAQAGGNCSQVISQIAREHAAFQREARKQGLDFLKDDTISSATAAVEPLLSLDPTMEIGGKLQDFRDSFDGWEAACKRNQITLDNLLECILHPKTHSLMDYLRRQTKAFQEWYTSISKGGPQLALERTRKASSLLKDYTSRLEGTAEGSISAAAECVSKYEQRAAHAADPVDPRNARSQVKPSGPSTQPQPQSGAKQGGGASAGAKVVGALVASGGVVAGFAIANKIGKDAAAASCTTQETAATNALVSMQNQLNSLLACGTSESCYNARFGGFTGAWSAWGSALGNWCSCAGVSGSISSSDKAAVQQAWAAAPAAGFNPGTLPSCFR